MKQPINAQQLAEVYKEYLLTENPTKVLVVLSKPKSGRTTILEDVARKIDKPYFNRHIYSCPYSVTKSAKWFHSYLDKIMSEIDTEQHDNHVILELDPSQFVDIPYYTLFMDDNFYLDAFVSNDKYQVVLFRLTAEDILDYHRINNLHSSINYNPRRGGNCNDNLDYILEFLGQVPELLDEANSPSCFISDLMHHSAESTHSIGNNHSFEMVDLLYNRFLETKGITPYYREESAIPGLYERMKALITK